MSNQQNDILTEIAREREQEDEAVDDALDTFERWQALLAAVSQLARDAKGANEGAVALRKLVEREAHLSRSHLRRVKYARSKR